MDEPELPETPPLLQTHHDGEFVRQVVEVDDDTLVQRGVDEGLLQRRAFAHRQAVASEDLWKLLVLSPSHSPPICATISFCPVWDSDTSPGLGLREGLVSYVVVPESIP